MSAISASIAAQTATTGAPSVAAWRRTASRSGLSSKPCSFTLATYSVGFAVSRKSGLQHRLLLVVEVERAHRPRFVQHRQALLEHRDEPLRLLVAARARDLAVARELPLDRREVGERELGVDRLDVRRPDRPCPTTWTTFGSSKQRTTCAIASVSRMLARNWLPRPSPFDAPATSPAMSTNSTTAGITFSGFAIAASASSRGSGTSTMPVFGSIVQNG